MRKCKLLFFIGLIVDDRVDNVSFRDLRLLIIILLFDNVF